MPKGLLVTGSNRSGTTWVGRMLEKSSEYAYLDEPFHLHHRLGIFNKSIDKWYLYVSHHNAVEYEQAFKDTLHYRYNLLPEILSIRSARDFLRMVRDGAKTSYFRIKHKKPLIKDPIAVFSAEWLANRYDLKVIVLVRHPAAFVNSIINAGWSHPFEHFLEQPQLMEDHLTDFRMEIEQFASNQRPLIEQAILLWNIFYSMINKYRNRHPDWLFIKHEDVSADPTLYYRRIFQYAGVPYTDEIDQVIKKYSSRNNPSKSDNPNSIALNSRRNIYRWKDDLDQDEIILVKEKTQMIWPEFYTEKEW